MVLYKCFRCGYECNQKGMLLNHLSRKNQCISKLKEINNIDILKLNKIEEYNKEKYNIQNIYKIYTNDIQNIYKIYTNDIQNIYKKYTNDIQNIYKKHTNKNECEYCKKIFSNYFSRWRHEKSCKIKFSLNDEITKKDNQVKELIETVKKLSKGNNTLIKGNNNNNNNNNNNITNNIVINNFENENIDYFNEKIVMKLVSNFNYMTGKFVELLHFNEKHPENHTIRIKDIKSGLGEIKEENNWKYLDINNFLDLVLRNLQDKLYFMRDKISDENISKFEDLYDLIAEILEDKRKLKNVKKDIKIASINGTNKIN